MTVSDSIIVIVTCFIYSISCISSSQDIDQSPEINTFLNKETGIISESCTTTTNNGHSLNNNKTECLHNNDIDNNTNTNNNNNNNYDGIDLSLDPEEYQYSFPCPGLKVGYKCDDESPWTNRDGDYDFCDIDTIHIRDLTYDTFMNEYLFKKPLIIDANLSDWSDIEFWSKKHWLDNYGKFNFEAGRSLELVLNSGIGTVNISLEEYFRDAMQLQLDEEYNNNEYDSLFKEPLYVFDRSIWREEDDFQNKHFDAPKYLFNSPDTQYGILFIGISGTGATWHAHGETWAGVAYGRKRWFVYPPEATPVGGFWPGYSAKDWFLNLYPNLKDNLTQITDTKDFNNFFKQNGKTYSTNVNGKNSNIEFLRKSVLQRRISNSDLSDLSDPEFISLNSDSPISDIMSSDFEYENNGLLKPFECVQKEGQLIYLPEFWWHAVLNIGDVVAGGIQTSESYAPWMQEIDSLGSYERLLSDEKRKKKHQNLFTHLEKQAMHYDMLLVHERLGLYAPYNSVHPFFVGFEYMEMENYDLAEKYLSEALLMDPTMIEGYIALGKIYRNSGNLWHNYLGERCLRIAYVLNRNHPRVRDMLIDIFEEQDRNDLIELVEKRLELPPVPEIDRQELEDVPMENDFS